MERTVSLAKSAGFCFGVKRAVNMVYSEMEEANEPIYTYGPIIHNDEVVKDMEKHGVRVIRSIEEVADLPTGKIIIRSHGVTRAEYQCMEAAGHEILDATCPFVKKIHRLAEQYTGDGYHLIIIGNPVHPEVVGIRGWCVTDRVTVLSSIEEAEAFQPSSEEKICIVAQTTFNYKKFEELVEIISKKGYDISVINTICSATEERQTEAREIARQTDAMIVIGDKNSSNTQKLFEICKKECENTYYIQTSNDMDYASLREYHHVGITAGASTPNNIIEEVSKNVRNEL